MRKIENTEVTFRAPVADEQNLPAAPVLDEQPADTQAEHVVVDHGASQSPAVDGQVQAEVDHDVLNQLDPEGVEKPAQAEATTVIFVPQKDFEGRINDTTYKACKGVPIQIPRDVANIWLEDESRGYVRD